MNGSELGLRTRMALSAPVIRQVLRPEEGQDMIEYALLVALVAVTALAIIVLVGPFIANVFQDVVNGLNHA